MKEFNPMDFHLETLHWFHDLEYFDTWRYTLATGKSFVHYNSLNLKSALENWLEDF